LIFKHKNLKEFFEISRGKVCFILKCGVLFGCINIRAEYDKSYFINHAYFFDQIKYIASGCNIQTTIKIIMYCILILSFFSYFSGKKNLEFKISAAKSKI